jgi:arylsulfatase A-like enzyme
MRYACPAILALAFISMNATSAEGPNVIVIVADDLGFADVGFNGSTEIPTPNIDSIAKNGVRCASGYVSHPYCSPTRAGLFAGRYQQKFGHECNPTFLPLDPTIGIPPSEILLPKVMSDAGYTSALIGKWHLGASKPFHPLARGFDEHFGFLGGGHQYFSDRWTVANPSKTSDEYITKLLRNGSYVDEAGYMTDTLSREGVSFIQRHQKAPFLLCLMYNAPHTPLQAPENYLNRFPAITDPKRKKYAAMISAMDDGIGQVLTAVKECGLDEHTLIFFLSDNGGATDSGAVNAPLKGCKGQVYEGGIRVPFAVQWKGTIPAGSEYLHPVSSLDIYATAVAVAGAKVPSSQILDGVNLIPFFTGKKTEPPHKVLYWRTGGGDSYAARMGKWKWVKAGDQPAELYDLSADIGESRNLISQNAEVVEKIESSVTDWNSQLVKPLFGDPVRSKKTK